MAFKLKMLPPMQCDVGCGQCCGIVPVTKQEYEKVVFVARAKGIVPVSQGITCPFYQKGVCSVYDARPLVCKLFGHQASMECVHGYNTNVPESVGDKAVRQNGVTSRFLHEALVEFGVEPDIQTALIQHLETALQEDENA